MQVGRALKRALMAAPRKKLLWLMRSNCKNFVAQYLLPYLDPWTKRITLVTRKEKSRRSAPLRRNLLRTGICFCSWEPSAAQGESGGAYSGDAAGLLYRYGPLFLASILSPSVICLSMRWWWAKAMGAHQNSCQVEQSLNRLLPSPSSASIWPNIFLMYYSLILD